MVWLIPIPGFEGKYMAGSDGFVYSCQTGKRMYHDLHKRHGRYFVHLRKDGKRLRKAVHTLIALAFHGDRPEDMEVSHLDGNRLFNAPHNLRYESHPENIYRKYAHGTMKRSVA